MPPALPPIPPNIAYIAAPPLIGIFINWGLLGALIVQVFLYQQEFKDDRKWIKCLVYGLFILEIVQTALCTADAVKWFAIGYGNVIALSKPEFSTVDAPVLDAIIALVVQLTFCWRIKVLSESWVAPIGIAAVASIQVVGALASAVRMAQLDDLSKMDSLTLWIALWFGGSALTDTLISATMISLLLRRSAGSSHSKDLIQRMVRLTIETNALTALAAIVGFIISLAAPVSSANMVPAYILGKLYSNSLLAVFNNRIFIKNRTDGSSGGYQDSTIAFQLTSVSTGSVHPSRLSQLTGSAMKRDNAVGKSLPECDVSGSDLDISFSRETRVRDGKSPI